jgi:hypothetical protein
MLNVLPLCHTWGWAREGMVGMACSTREGMVRMACSTLGGWRVFLYNGKRRRIDY